MKKSRLYHLLIISFCLSFLFAFMSLINRPTAVSSSPVDAVHSSKPVINSLTTTLYLPIIMRPYELLPSPEAQLQITPNRYLNASTYEPGAFVLTNLTTHDQKITQVRLDLSNAVFPDMVFDPAGSAGDIVAKDLSIDQGGAETGFIARTYHAPHDGGYDVLEMSFNSFDPGDQLHFSIDVDPTSIRGSAAPGPNGSGSVCGAELVGSAVTITFDNGAILTGYVYRELASFGGGEALIRDYLPASPTITIADVPAPPTAVTDPQQLLQINGRANTLTRILIIEGGLFTDGVPGGGFDLDPFEANSAVNLQEYLVTTHVDGTAQIPITLTRSDPDGGLNMIYVVQENPYGHRGQGSEIVLELIGIQN